MDEPMLVVLTGPPGTGKSTLASAAAELLGAPVLGWDWAMASLTGYPELQAVFDGMERARYRAVGWSILGNLAAAQLREGRSAVVDGVARTPDVERCRRLAAAERAACVVVATTCSDRAVHRTRIEGRRRDIPGWHELEWDDVARSADHWEEPGGVDLRLDAMEPMAENVARLAVAVGRGAR